MSDQIYTLEDFEGRRWLPPGKYAGVICGVLNGNTAKGTATVRFLIRAEEPLSGQDIEGVEMSVELKSETFFDTKPAIPRLAAVVKRVNPSALKPGTAKELADSIVMEKVSFDFVQKKARDGSDRTFWECINISAA